MINQTVRYAVIRRNDNGPDLIKGEYNDIDAARRGAADWQEAYPQNSYYVAEAMMHWLETV